MEKVTIYFKQNWLTILGVVLGIGGGFAYWFYIGCTSGTCPITSNPYMSMIWGGVFGGLLFSLFNKKNK